MKKKNYSNVIWRYYKICVSFRITAINIYCVSMYFMCNLHLSQIKLIPASASYMEKVSKKEDILKKFQQYSKCPTIEAQLKMRTL